MRIQITFKSGAQIKIDADDITWNHNSLTNEIVEYSIIHPADARLDSFNKLLYMQPDEIIAMVRMRDDSTNIPDSKWNLYKESRDNNG
jgi:hypothetical protein